MIRWLAHPIALVIFGVVSVVFFYSLHTQEQKFGESESTVSQLEEVNQQKAAEIAQLQQELEQSQTPLEQEKIIRNQLLMQKPGEYVVQLDMESNSPDSEPNNIDAVTPWEAWRALLLE